MLGILRQKHRAMPIIAALMLTMLVWMLPTNVLAAEATAAVKAAYSFNLSGVTDETGNDLLNGKKIDGEAITWDTNLNTTMTKFAESYNTSHATGKAYQTATWDNTTKKLTLTAAVAGAVKNTNKEDGTTAPKAPPITDIAVSTPATKSVYVYNLTGVTDADMGTEKKIDGTAPTWNTDRDATMKAFETAYNAESNTGASYKAEWKDPNLTLTAKTAGAPGTTGPAAPVITLTKGAVKGVEAVPAKEAVAAVYKSKVTIADGKTFAENDAITVAEGTIITVVADGTTPAGNNQITVTNANKIAELAPVIASNLTSDVYTISAEPGNDTTPDTYIVWTAKKEGAVGKDTNKDDGTTAPKTAPTAPTIENLTFEDVSEATKGADAVEAVQGVEAKDGTALTPTSTTAGTEATDAETLTAVVVTAGKDAETATDPTQPTTPSTPGGSGSGGTTPSTPTTPTTPTNPDTPTTPGAPTIEVKPDGTKVETSTETQPDGTKVETVTETKPDGTKTETKTETKVDGSTVENKVVTETNGTTVKTEVITNADGTVQRESEATIKADGSATEVVKETQTNTAGKQVASTITTKTDAEGKLLSETKTAVIANPAKDTTATVTIKTNAAGITTAAAAVTKPGTERKSGTNGIVYASIVKQITEAAGTKDVTIRQKVTDQDGKAAFTVQVNARDLTAGKNLTIVKLDKKGNPVLVNAKTYPVTAAGNVSVTMNQSGTYQLLNASEANKVSNAILKTVQVKKTNTSVKKGKKTSMALSSKLNKSNVAKITYSTSNKSVVKVSKSGTIAAKKKGTAIVKAKVTLKNGKTKTVQMKVKVK